MRGSEHRRFGSEAEAIEAWNTRTPEQAIAATLGDDVYDAVANEHVITAEQLHALLDEWDKHPGRAAIDGEMMTYAALCGGKRESSKERLQKMLDEMKKLARDGRREWCGRSHGEFGIFVALDDFAETTEQRIDRPWMWR